MRSVFFLLVVCLAVWVGYSFYPGSGFASDLTSPALQRFAAFVDPWLNRGGSVYLLAFALYVFAAWRILIQCSRYLILRLVYLVLLCNPVLLYVATSGQDQAVLLALWLLAAGFLIALSRLQKPRDGLYLFLTIWLIVCLSPSMLLMCLPLICFGFYLLPRQYHALALWLKSMALAAIIVLSVQAIDPQAVFLPSPVWPALSLDGIWYAAIHPPTPDVFDTHHAQTIHDELDAWSMRLPLLTLWPYLLLLFTMLASYLLIQSRNTHRLAALALIISCVVAALPAWHSGGWLWLVASSSLSLMLWQWPPRGSLRLRSLRKPKKRGVKRA